MPDWFRESDEYAWFRDNPAPHQVEEDAKNRAYEAALEESRNWKLEDEDE